MKPAGVPQPHPVDSGNFIMRHLACCIDALATTRRISSKSLQNDTMIAVWRSQHFAHSIMAQYVAAISAQRT